MTEMATEWCCIGVLSNADGKMHYINYTSQLALSRPDMRIKINCLYFSDKWPRDFEGEKIGSERIGKSLVCMW